MEEHSSVPELSRREMRDLWSLVHKVAVEVAGFLRDKFGLEDYTRIVLRHSYDGDESLRVDVLSEKNIIDLLRAEGFNGYFLGEEHGLVKISEGPFIAVVDPLDGSRNYASLIPWCAVSIAIALMPENREPRLSDIIVGAVAPVHNWPVISFIRGQGVYEGSMRVQPKRPPAKMVLAYFEKTEQARVVQRYMSLAPGRTLRSLGSACLEIAWASLGRAEAFIDIHGRLRVVDVAAALGIAAESGSTVIVENINASLTRIERVGSVAIASSTESMNILAKALKLEGCEHLLKNIFNKQLSRARD